MSLEFRPLHGPSFVAEVSGTRLTGLEDPAVLRQIREGMDRYAVLVFHDQPLTLSEQLAFAERLDGAIHRATTV